MFQSQTTAQAKNYFRDALSKSDYYIDDQEMNGRFHGHVARRLGLEGQTVDKATFDKLCDNINPQTGESLTPRTVANRRVGYDISFHAPKSVSILHGLGNDKRVLKVFEASVKETMGDIERDMQTRVRIQGQYRDRDAPELIWADFTHQTARPTKHHVADPHLHTHAFCLNTVYDPVEQRFKAGQFHNVKRDMPYYQALFQKRLADKLNGLGYGIRKTENGFEVATIPQKAIDIFSKRTNLIGQVARDKNISNPKDLDKLGARTREGKNKNLTMAELKAHWHAQLKEAGVDEKTPEEKMTIDKSQNVNKTVNQAIEHVFTRNSVKRDRQILAEAYKLAVDNPSIKTTDLDEGLEKNSDVFKIQVGGQRLCTTALVHKEERNMIELARRGIGKHHPLKYGFDAEKFTHLNDEQKLALQHVMTAQDRLMMIRGAAGTGKTTLFKTMVPEIEKANKKVYLFAPTAEASRDVLKQEGFKEADTVSRFLHDKKLQDKVAGQVMIIDEAGMLGSQDMAAILKLADEGKTRVILSGDPRQHTAVLRGDAMRLLKDVGHIDQVSLETIYRQKSNTYKEAVKEISKGNVRSGFQQLDKMGAIQECPSNELSEKLVEEYLATRRAKKSAIVVTPTRANMKQINEDIRQGLKAEGLLGKREKSFTVYRNHYLTETQKKDGRHYRPGHFVQTHQNLPGIKKGSKLKVDKVDGSRVEVQDEKGAQHILPLDRAKDFDLYSAHDIKLSRGDEIRIVNKNGFDKQGQRLNNRTSLKVVGFTKEGDIKTMKETALGKRPFLLPKDHGNFEYAYGITSYSSQGKTVDRVLIAQPATTFLASNQKQFYVSVSRGREDVMIYTDDKEDLMSSIIKEGDRQGATELKKVNIYMTMAQDLEKERVLEQVKIRTIDIDYEPEL
jgi:conjugative relaxase-like TrwC/TraI family protein